MISIEFLWDDWPQKCRKIRIIKINRNHNRFFYYFPPRIWLDNDCSSELFHCLLYERSSVVDVSSSSMQQNGQYFEFWTFCFFKQLVQSKCQRDVLSTYENSTKKKENMFFFALFLHVLALLSFFFYVFRSSANLLTE